MILQALYEYYQRKAADPGSTIAPHGLEWKEIPYLILIDKKGNFLAYIIHSGFISGYQNRYGDNLKPPTNVYHRMTA